MYVSVLSRSMLPTKCVPDNGPSFFQQEKHYIRYIGESYSASQRMEIPMELQSLLRVTWRFRSSMTWTSKVCPPLPNPLRPLTPTLGRPRVG